jgi:hypothetical protein
MTPAGPTVSGLLGALEEFAEREAVLLGAGDYAGFAAVRRREAPLIARLCELAGAFDSEALSGRLGALLLRRRQNLSMLQERTAFLRAERQRLAETQQRLRQVSPYGQVAPDEQASARLNAAV